MHKHSYTDELFYIIDPVHVVINDTLYPCLTGDMVHVKKGDVHKVINHTGKDSRILVFKMNYKKGDSFLN